MTFTKLHIKIFYCLVFFCFIIPQDTRSQAKNERPVFQLNHVDICIDSISFNKILNNRFLSDSFAFMKVLEDSTGSEILLLGKESFIHLLPAKGFFINRIGACLLVHHSFRWEETTTLQQYLQTYIQDSLYNRPYLSPDLSIDYINVYEKIAEGDKLLYFIPILQNHSKKDYLSWGYTTNDLKYGISQHRYMNDYVGKETIGKLFQNILAISISTTQKEIERLKPLLEAYGYKKKRKSFILDGSPVILLSKMKEKIRVVRITILLSHSVDDNTIQVSDNTSLLMSNNKAIFIYKITED